MELMEVIECMEVKEFMMVKGVITGFIKVMKVIV